MARIVKVKNNTNANKTWMGQTIASGIYYEIPENNIMDWNSDSKVFGSVASGTLIVNDGSSDLTNITDGWSWLQGSSLTASLSSERHTGDGKLRVLSSHKPLLSDGRASYNYFAGEGDLISSGTVGKGQPIQIVCVSGTSEVSMDIKFLNCVYPPEEIWIFGGSVMWQDANFGDTFSMEIRTLPSPVVPRVVATGMSLPVDYDLDGDRIKYAGPDLGDYALGGLPVFVPNWDGLGYWDLDSTGTSAVPNMLGTGEFDWHTTDSLVGNYMQKVPILGTNPNPSPIDATEAAPLPYGHYIRIVLNCDEVNNEPSLIGYLRIYRERLK